MATMSDATTSAAKASSSSQRSQQPDIPTNPSSPISRNNTSVCNCDECQPWLYVDRDDIHICAKYGLNGNPNDELIPGAHEPLDLARRTIAIFDEPIARISREQEIAVWTWMGWRQSPYAAMLDVGDLSHVPVEELRIPFGIFNRFFFRGAIRGANFCWGELGENGKHGYLTSETAATCSVSDDLTHAYFTFSPRRPAPKPGRRYVDGLLSDLLHEMTHAFIDQYACVGDRCQRPLCKSLARANRGITGHGRAWYRIAEAVSHVAADIFHFRADLGIKSAIRREASTPGGVDPSKHEPMVCDAVQCLRSA
ncbi:hypothetical protein LTR36_004727 [Oleoguttula mirabilis]|uniref:Lysine-specific metallo-endopeptidase domain-containing protein n=1 Tax=Oleoguttula mirabilis TaxID=1507867 RepID=A0AAV9JGG4_9PEZI|nr:hypothetical protein LTR36_004727 [Oleoguttula mirabilis]